MDATSVVEEVGTIDGVSCGIALTGEPWTLDIDAIIVSVGTGLGGLGLGLRDRFPDAPWRSVKFTGIVPEQPQLLHLDGAKPASALRFAVLASPHEGGGVGTISARSVITATDAAIRLAGSAGAHTVGVPLLATGALGVSAQRVAEDAVSIAIQVAAAAGLLRLVFICRDKETADAIRSAMASYLSLVADDGAAHKSGATGIPTPQRRVSGTGIATWSETELAGGVSSDLVDPNKGIPLTQDHLGIAPYVSMLATVIADRGTTLPLSIGIFGEWGSGKSYFMGLLREQVKNLARSGNPAYCGRIEQIGFNAWHYADSNLWASLGDEIFRQLAEPDPTAAEQRGALRTDLAARLTQRRCLEAATEQARVEVAALQASVDAAVADRGVGARDLVAALRDSEQLGTMAESLWQRLGVNDDVEQGKLLVEQFHGTLTEADALARIPWNRRGRMALAAAAVVLVIGGVVAALAPAATAWLASVGGVFTALAGGGIAALSAARSGLRRLRELSEELHTRMRQAAGERPLPADITDKLDALRRAEAEQRVAEAQLSEVVSRVGELGRQLAELTPGRRLYTFLADRAHGDSYTRNLGLISTIRKDFQQLVELMNDWQRERDSADGDTRQPVERIVLYIDDLDRCSPRQVVDVLQAVHLLLALELFVVVVGVDPRWLLRSLSSHYDEILSDDGGAVDAWQVTPEDYLEKILNIPIVLPGMSSGSLRGLLRSMVNDGTPAQKPVTPDTDGSDPTQSVVDSVKRLAQEPVDPNTITVEAGSEVDIQRDPRQPREIPRPLTGREINLLGALDLLVDTPREAKRLINLYRMLRATRDLSEASRFLGGEYQAVVVLLGLLTAHARLLGRVLDSTPIRTTASGEVWSTGPRKPAGIPSLASSSRSDPMRAGPTGSSVRCRTMRYGTGCGCTAG